MKMDGSEYYYDKQNEPGTEKNIACFLSHLECRFKYVWGVCVCVMKIERGLCEIKRYKDG